MTIPDVTDASILPGDPQTDASKGVAKASLGIALVTFGLSLMSIDAGVLSSGVLATGTALTTSGWSEIRGAQKRLQEKMDSEMKLKKALAEAESARIAEAETRKKLAAAKSETEKKLSTALWQQYSLVVLAASGLVISSYLWWRSRNIKQKAEAAEEKLNESSRRIYELEDRLLCVVCQDLERSHQCLPCKHLACCENCAALLVPKKCPMCRAPFDSIEKKDFY